VADCVISIAREQPRHPVRSYLDALQWDGRPRLSHWLIDYLHADGDEQYLVVVGRRFLIQAVAEPGDVLMIGEGIETCLAAMQETGHPAWAALSTSGLRALDLPKAVRDVIVLADGDDPGEAAARDLALTEAGRGEQFTLFVREVNHVRA